MGNSHGPLRKIAEGREAEIYEWEPGRVLRLFRGARSKQSLENEAAAMRAARSALPTVPAVYDLAEFDGRPGIVMERVGGVDLLTNIGRRPWTVTTAAAMTGRVHAELNRVKAPATLPDLREWIRGRVTRSDLVPTDAKYIALRGLESLPDGESLCHGDFHPGNILIAASGPVVIDWVNATRGDFRSDFARTSLMMRLGALPPGSPALLFATYRLGRALFARGYDRAYRRVNPVDNDLLDRWRLVRAIDRLVDDIDEERKPLLDFIAHHARRVSLLDLVPSELGTAGDPQR